VKKEKKEKVEDVISTVRAALTEVVAKVEEAEEPVQDDEELVPEDDGAGTGLIPLNEETVEEETVETPKTETLSDEVLEEDVSGETITFQGIEYTFDSEENMVYDDELAEVGTWDGETIEFINATAAKLHRVRKLALKSD